MKHARSIVRGTTILGTLLIVGCAARPPSIAHVHVGHAMTAVHVTPGQEGYMATAERAGQEANDLALQAITSSDLAQIKEQIARVVVASNSDEEFGVKHSLIMAANHISFAATSADASLNLQKAAPIFAGNISRPVERCQLIALLGKDVAAADTLEEGRLLAEEIQKLTAANLGGEDVDEDGDIGSTPAEYGLSQLRGELEAMVAAETPRYAAIDNWYLFNLVRLPNGRWVFDKLGRGGNIEGYK